MEEDQELTEEHCSVRWRKCSTLPFMIFSVRSYSFTKAETLYYKMLDDVDVNGRDDHKAARHTNRVTNLFPSFLKNLNHRVTGAGEINNPEPRCAGCIHEQRLKRGCGHWYMTEMSLQHKFVQNPSAPAKPLIWIIQNPNLPEHCWNSPSGGKKSSNQTSNHQAQRQGRWEWILQGFWVASLSNPKNNLSSSLIQLLLEPCKKPCCCKEIVSTP